MLHQTIENAYGGQKKSFNRLVRLLFSIAGIYWIFIYILLWTGTIVTQELANLRAGQTWIYFILLTLWGAEYLRETRRYRAIIAHANSQHIPPDEVELERIEKSWPSFSIMRPIHIHSKAWTMPIINIVMLFVAFGLIIRQYFLAVVASFQ